MVFKEKRQIVVSQIQLLSMKKIYRWLPVLQKLRSYTGCAGESQSTLIKLIKMLLNNRITFSSTTPSTIKILLYFYSTYSLHDRGDANQSILGGKKMSRVFNSRLTIFSQTSIKESRNSPPYYIRGPNETVDNKSENLRKQIKKNYELNVE